MHSFNLAKLLLPNYCYLTFKNSHLGKKIPVIPVPIVVGSQTREST